MTETEKKLNLSLVEKVGGMRNYTLICMYLAEVKALKSVRSLTEEEGRCQNRPLCREMEGEGLKALIESDKTIEEEILNFINPLK